MLKCKKAPGLDRIKNEMLKYSQHILTPLLIRLFNGILQTGIYPSSWSNSYIIPIHKSDDPTLPANYRGIAISSSLAKLFNTILNNRLNEFIISNSVINEVQIGFRKGSRTSDHMFIIKTLIDKYTMNGNKLFACFVDFRKAYDSVNHMKLLLKLKHIGVGSLFYNLVKDMYLLQKGKTVCKN